MFIEKVTGFLEWDPGLENDYNYLTSLLPIEGMELNTIGHSTDDDYPIYSLTYGDTSKGNTLMTVGGMHAGTEWVAVYYGLEFVNALVNPSEHPEQEPYLRWIMEHYDAIVHVVCVNPWGFVNGTRRNKNDVDLNRNFDSASPQQETVVMKNIIEEVKPKILIDCHERGSTGVGIASVDNYRGGVDNNYLDVTYRAIRYNHHLAQERTDYHGGQAADGEMRRWASTEAENYQGGQIWSFITESGDSGNTRDMAAERARRGINALFSINLALYEIAMSYAPFYKKGGELIPVIIKNSQGMEQEIIKKGSGGD